MKLNKLQKEALLYCQNNQLDQAEKIYEKILIQYPQDIQSLSNLGLIYLHKSQYFKAEKIYDELYKFEKNVNFLKNYINLKFEIRKYESILEIIISNDLNLNIFYEQLLKAYRYLKKFKEAYEIIKNKSNEDLNSIGLVIEHCMIFNHLKMYDKAINIIKVNEKKFSSNDLLNINLAISLRNKSEYKEAIQILKKINIEKSELANQLKIELIKNYLDTEEIKVVEKIIENEKVLNLKSELIALTGDYYLENSRFDEAIKKYKEAISIYEDNYAAKTSLAEIYLSNEMYEDGLKFYKWRVRRGMQLNKRFFVDDINIDDVNFDDIQSANIIGEQGIGDEIFYLRFLDLIRKEQRNKINLYLDERLLDIAKENLKGFNIFPISQVKNIIKDHQTNINIGSIPRLIDWNIEKLRKVVFVNYEQIPKNNMKKRIGISWSSKNFQLEDYKSIKLDKLCKVFQKQKDIFEVLSLQYGDWSPELEKIKKENHIDIIRNKKDDLYNDINKLVSLICSCDLIITVCNVTAHIAGLFGIKTIVMIPKYRGRLWYWSGEKSRWYPNATYFTQDNDQNWDNVIEKLSIKLREMIL